jgi:hypothetical protein
MFSILPTDEYISPAYDPILAKLDNYQTYSIVMFDKEWTEKLTFHGSGGYTSNYQPALPGIYENFRGQGLYLKDGNQYHSQFPVFIPPPLEPQEGDENETITKFVVKAHHGFYNLEVNRSATDGIETIPALDAIAFESFSPRGKINFDMATLIRSYPIKARKETHLHHYNQPEFFQFQTFAEAPHPSFVSLFRGFLEDNRLRPSNIKAIATTTRKILFAYYRSNPYESHPKLNTSLDWHEGSISVVAGKNYVLPLTDPMLGTLMVDNITRQELLAVEMPSNTHPTAHLFLDALPGLFSYWESLRPPFVVNTANLPYASDPGPLAANAIWLEDEYIPAAPIVRIIAATNDRWGFGSVTNNYNPPPPTHSIFDFNEYEFFERQMIDGSYGTYMVDSPRLRELHNAMNAEKYNQIDPETGELVSVNLSVLIEKIAALLGYRPEPNNTHDISKEKEQTRRLMGGDAPVQEQDYGGNYFGKKGMLMRRVPNVFNKAGEAGAGGVVAVHDIPQMLAEIMDGLNIALGVQQSGAIAIKTGNQTLRYPNQLELLTDIARTTNSTYQLAQKGYISSLVGQMQGKEIIGGLGLPTVFRTTNVVIDNKLQQLPYPGISPQHSIARKQDNCLYNIGILIGSNI